MVIPFLELLQMAQSLHSSYMSWRAGGAPQQHLVINSKGLEYEDTFFLTIVS
jgi:hypothetical protein